jgi:hypothetical protein
VPARNKCNDADQGQPNHTTSPRTESLFQEFTVPPCDT